MARKEPQEVRDIQNRERYQVDGREICARCRRPADGSGGARTINNELLCDDCIDDMDL